MINYTLDIICRNEEKVLKGNNNEENCTDIHPPELFDTACNNTDISSDKSE